MKRWMSKGGLAFVVFTRLGALDNPSPERQANAYAEAREFNTSADLFRTLAKDPLEPWQKDRLWYNIGSLYLQENDWQQSAQAFSEIDPSPDLLLKRALATNRAVLLYRQAAALSKDVQSPNLDGYRTRIYLFLDALKAVKEAKQAQCLLEAQPEGAECRDTGNLNELQGAIKSGLAQALDGFGQAKITDSSIKEGIPFLLAGVNLANSHIDFLEKIPASHPLREEYVKLFAKDAESWLSLWEAQIAQLDSLEKSYQEYKSGVEGILEDQLPQARLAFLSCEASLSELMRTLWGLDPMVKLIQNLLASYQKSLLQLPIQAPTLYQLQAEQRQIEGEAAAKGILSPELKTSSGFLAESIQYAKAGKSDPARFFLLMAKHPIEALLRRKTEAGNVPEEILKNAIEDQIHAITLHRLSQGMPEMSSWTQNYILEAQRSVLEAAVFFLPAVLAQETRDFPARCQCKPWDSVIPLFEKGKEAASMAASAIQFQQRPLQTMTLQENALKYWREALEKLKHPDTEASIEENPAESPPPQPAPAQPLNEVLRLLQQMEQEDFIPPPKKPLQSGMRPW